MAPRPEIREPRIVVVEISSPQPHEGRGAAQLSTEGRCASGLLITEEGDQQRIEVSPKPAASDPNPIWRGLRRATSDRLYEHRWKIRAGINGKLKGTPESAVDFHQLGNSISFVKLELDHRHTCPVERS